MGYGYGVSPLDIILRNRDLLGQDVAVAARKGERVRALVHRPRAVGLGEREQRARDVELHPHCRKF